MSIHGVDTGTDEREVEPDDLPEVWQTHIKDPDSEFTLYAETKIDNPEHESSDTYTGRSRLLVLSKGGSIGEDTNVSPKNPYEWQTNSVGNLNRTVTFDAVHGIGYYVYGVETHDTDEQAVMNGLEKRQSEVGLPLDEYYEFQSGLDTSSRKLRLLDLLDWRVSEGGDWASEPYLNNGTWRDTGLSKSAQRLAQRIESEIDVHPRLCYRTAQSALNVERDNPRVKYVEGVALPKQAAQAVRHAWIEIDGSVVELTWPWHKYDGGPAVYFGMEFDTETVIETYERREGGSQIALDDDEARELLDARANRGTNS
jgi:hypothetical protein